VRAASSKGRACPSVTGMTSAFSGTFASKGQSFASFVGQASKLPGRAGERLFFARYASLGPSVIPGAKGVAESVANELRGATNVDDSVPDEARGTANVGEMAMNQPARARAWSTREGARLVRRET
jgi:hypothetical protein